MDEDTNTDFIARADAHINLANSHLPNREPGRVTASFMYGSSRFNAWISATGFSSAQEMQAQRDETLDYFVTQYREMLEENLDDYIENFDKYMRSE